VSARYISLDAGHFALLVKEDETRAAITAFLRARGDGSRRAARARREEPHR
jgi:hypothetical protein